MTLIQSQLFTPNSVGIFYVNDNNQPQELIQQSITMSFIGEVEAQYSIMQVDSNLQSLSNENTKIEKITTLIITKFTEYSLLHCDLSSLKKLIIKCKLPCNKIIINLPKLRHLELISASLQTIDAFHSTKLISIKFKDQMTPINVISLPPYLESLYIDSNDKMIMPRIKKHQLDYIYLSNASWYYQPSSPPISIYFDLKKLNFDPISGKSIVDTLPNKLPQAPSNLQNLMKVHHILNRISHLKTKQISQKHPQEEENEQERMRQLQEQQQHTMRKLVSLKAEINNSNLNIRATLGKSSSSLCFNGITEQVSDFESDEFDQIVVDE